ncbi:MAG: outer membrane protein beta-barrel domain [Bacteroidota bacterium]|jgi:hypothetical protein
MKKLLLIAVMACAAQWANAQGAWDILHDIKSNDSRQVHWHVGFGIPRTENFYFDKYQGEINYNLNGAGPFYTRFEYSFNRKLSLSLGASYTNYWNRWLRNGVDPSTGVSIPYEYGLKVNNYTGVAKLYYHLSVTPRWDWYICGGGGYQMFMHTDYTKNTLDTTFNSYFKNPYWPTWEAGAGFRHFFLKRTAVFAEVGYGKSYAQVGFIIKVAQPKRNRIF